MANETIYPKGIRTFAKHQNAPDFVLGTVVITLKELREWALSEGNQYLTDYKGEKQLRLQATKAKDGSLSLKVDTWKPTQTGTNKQHESQDLQF
jgi:hypothetical protein